MQLLHVAYDVLMGKMWRSGKLAADGRQVIVKVTGKWWTH